MQLARQMSKEQTVVVCLSGRGDKDAAEIALLKSASR
jgi:tryptophan synthase beta chain